jgi:DMSO/TMAO reductase YedYZ molybdopterin-dependent catalytic subunit
MRNLFTTVLLLTMASELFGGATSYAVEPALQIRGLAGNNLSWEIDDLKRLPRQSAKIEDSPGVFAEYQGVTLHDVLKTAGAPTGKEVSGAALKHFVVVRAADGYQAVFALAETDPAFTDRLILLCYLKNGKALSADEGPLRLVIPAEKRHARWVRQIQRIDLKLAE